MKTERKQSKSLFRIDVKDLNTRKVKGFNVYETLNEKRGISNKINFIEFVEKLKEKVEEI